MKSLQSKLREFKGDLILACPQRTYHYHRPERARPPYLVWAEDGEGEYPMNADNHKAEQSIHGYADYFTLTEFDPVVDSVQEILNARGSEWRLTSVQYEEETNLIHYAWEWTI